MIIVCKGCSKKLRVSDEMVGKRFRCSSCQTMNFVPLDDLEVLDDEPPARGSGRTRRSDRDDSPERPRSGPPPLPTASRSSSPLLYVLLAILGVLVVGVLGVGLLAALWLTSVVPPRDPAKPPLVNPEPPTWNTFSPAQARFRVLLPHPASQASLPANPALPDLRTHKFATPLHLPTVFSIAELCFPPDTPDFSFERGYTAERDNLQRIGRGQVTKEQDVRLGALAGKEFHLLCEDGSVQMVRMYHARGEGRFWIWVLTAGGKDVPDLNLQATRYFDSFELRDLNIQGDPVVIGPKPIDPRPIDPRPIDPRPIDPTPATGKAGLTFLDPLPEHAWFQAVAEKPYNWPKHQTDHPVWDERSDTRVLTLAFHPATNLLATGTVDKRIRLWDWTKPEESQIVATDPGFWVSALAFRPDGKHLAYAAGGRVFVLDRERKKLASALEVRDEWGKQDGEVRALAYSSDGKSLLMGVRRSPHPRSELILVDLAERKILARRTELPGEPMKFRFAHKDRLFVFLQKNVQICTASNLEIKHEIRLDKDEEAMVGATVDPWGEQIAVLCVDRKIRLYDARTGKQEKTWPFPRKGLHVIPHHMEYTPDGKYLVMNSNSDLFVYDITKGQPHREPIDRGQPIDALAFSADSKVFALTTYGGPRLFNTKRLTDALARPVAPREVMPGETTVPPPPTIARIDSVRCQPGGSLLAVVRADNKMELWDPTTNRSFAQPEKDAPANLPHFSPDGSQLVYLTATGTVVCYNVADRKELCRIPRLLTEAAPLAVTLINGGKTIVTASPKKGNPTQTVLTLYEAATGKALEDAPVELPARVLLLHTAGNHLIAQADDRLLVCDAKAKVLFPLVPRDSKQMTRIAVSTDGQQVSARVENRLVTWALRTGKIVSEWDLPEGVHYFLYLKDSPYLLMSNNGEAFKLLGTHDGKIYTYPLRPLQITAHMDLSSGGDKLFLGGVPQPRVMPTAPILRVLPATPAVPDRPVSPEPPVGEVAAIKLSDKAFVTNLAVAPDGKTVAVALRGGVLKLWDFENRRDLHQTRDPQEIHALDFHPESKLVAYGTADGQVVLWNTQTAKEQARHRLKLAKSSKAGQVSVLRFTPKGGGLVVGHHLGEESEWLLIDAELGKVIHRQALHRSRPLHIEWLPDGKFLAASERSVYRFDLLKFEQSMNMIIDPPLNAFGLSSDGKEFWTRASDGRLARYSLERGLRLGVSEMDAPSAKESAWCSVVRLAGRKQTLISGSGQEVSLCDFTSPADPVRTLPLGKTPPGVHPLVATPDGKHLLAANIGGEVKIFEVDAVIRGSKP